MAASDHLQPHQLSMFMSAREVADTHDLSDAHPGLAPKALFERKQKQNKMYGLDERVAAEGVHAPLSIDNMPRDFGKRPMVTDGHHRLAAQLAADPDRLMPVQHFDRDNNESMVDDYSAHGGTWSQHLRQAGRSRFD